MELVARFGHEIVLLGTSFDDAWFRAVGAMRVDHEFRQRRSGFGGAEPAQGVDEANAVDGHFLSACGFEHHHSDQVVDQRVDGQFFEDAVDTVTVQHFHFHRRLEVPQIDFDPPTATIKFGDVTGGVANGIEQCGDDGYDLGSATGLFDREADFAHDEHFGKSIVVVLSHPFGLLFGLDVFDELIVLAEAFEPT